MQWRWRWWLEQAAVAVPSVVVVAVSAEFAIAKVKLAWYRSMMPPSCSKRPESAPVEDTRQVQLAILFISLAVVNSYYQERRQYCHLSGRTLH